MTIDEFNQCVDLYADNLYRFILKSVKDKDKAKDIVQDTYEKLWLKVSDVKSVNAKSYMFTTAYRTMIDVFRKDKKQTRLEDGQYDELISHKKHYSDLKEILNEAVNKLPEIQRMVLMLRDYEGYSYEEIEQITQLNESQVKVYIFRARVFLKNYIGNIESVL
jgi:RNA polymerase sigma factor (sigma-70 family)